MSYLPTPNAAFDWSAETWGAALRCRPLSAIAQHGFSTRQLRLRGGGLAHDGWPSVAAMAGVAVDRLARIKQVHGASVRIVVRGTGDLHDVPEADALVSNDPETALAVLVADCVPVLIADGDAGVAAAVHAGWRGTAAGVVREAVSAMVALGATPAALVAAIGPSIGPCCYEVGAELIDAFRRTGHAERDIDRWFTRVPASESAGGSLRLDVARANLDQLVAAGVPSQQIHSCDLCTRTHSDVFDSYRADGTNAGRMAAVIRVPRVEAGL